MPDYKYEPVGCRAFIIFVVKLCKCQLSVALWGTLHNTNMALIAFHL